MPDALLATELQIPRIRAGRVPRPRVLERLNAGMSRPLSLIPPPGRVRKDDATKAFVSASRSMTPSRS